jgi:nitrogen fixation/metabolism regulation signal transduction histidine kinase
MICPRSSAAKFLPCSKRARRWSISSTNPPTALGQRFQISITPFRKDNSETPTAALLVVEDCTATDRLRQLEIETANLRLVQQMAERLAHEIGNAVVPISTHQQLLRERGADPDFQASLAEAMEEGVKRVSRLVDQMRFLARDRMSKVESVPVKQLIEEAFREARAYHPSTTVLLQYESSGEPLSRHLRPARIATCLCRNHSQRPASQPLPVKCRCARARKPIQADRAGRGLKCRTAGRASAPRLRTRPPSRFSPRARSALGLGLAVTSKIIQTHAGKMEIPPPRDGVSGLVRVSLPLGPALSGATDKSAAN